jgi:cytochrome o ubiquinol oxidase subunit I
MHAKSIDESPVSGVFGRLDAQAFPIHEPILVATFVGVALGGLVVLGVISYFRLWGYLWREWVSCT